MRNLFVLVTSMMCALAASAVEIEPLSAKDMERIWNDFTLNDDAGSRQAFQGIQQLIRAPKVAVPFLRERLRPAPAPDTKRIEQVIAHLDSGDFSTREKATKELESLGIAALPLLAKKLQDKDLPLEMSNRLQRLVGNLEVRELSADELRGIRAVEVLQGIGSREARAVLDELSRGADGVRLTIDARRALSLLSRLNAGK